MNHDIQQKRIWAIQRFLDGEKPESICVSFGCSRTWLYKWLSRYFQNESCWYSDQSKRPLSNPLRTSAEIEEIVKMVRLSLYNRDLFCGAQAIRWEMEEMNVQPLPSIRTINRILYRHDLTHRRTGRYEPKGRRYPKISCESPNELHQADFVGPCYLSGPTRFYSLNVVDIATGRCAVHPLLSKSGQRSIDGFWSIWKRMGVPQNIQVDNEMSFYGSPTHPRGMGPLIRLCMHYKVDLWFIPPAEPWRNGVVEKFNEHYGQKFLGKIKMTSNKELEQASLAFEQKHNSHYRYSKLGGKTPLKALATMEKNLTFPTKEEAPRHPLKKPESGQYHLIRYIRSDLRLNVFGESFHLPSDLQHEYVVATIDVKEQKLKLFLDQEKVDEFDYKLR
jgi:putative transposase